ncbi:MAG TPA: thioredoxin family protein [Candidatus Blautia excrementipullorum]|nr:thioredoxin family protein [Candidatus Mediterraneibacter norwichensis]HJB16584.1 thioredoxin family protein [Candidatus Blautia excrementipullorum]
MAAINMNTEMFREMMNQGETVLVDFWAPWCTYCRRISAAYDKIAEQYEGKLKVAKINIDEEGALADEEQIEVIPTLVLYRGGQAIGSVVAPDSKAAIENFISETL